MLRPKKVLNFHDNCGTNFRLKLNFASSSTGKDIFVFIHENLATIILCFDCSGKLNRPENFCKKCQFNIYKDIKKGRVKSLNTTDLN